MKTIGRFNINNFLLTFIAISAIFAVTAAESAANSSPQAIGSIPAISVEADGAGETIAVSGYFTDPDGDVLSFLASSTDADVATVSVSGVDVTITPVGLGSTTASIMASDGSMTATQEIAVTVVPVTNQAPVAVGTLEAMEIKVDSLPVSLNVANSFSDPDGDALSFSAASSDENNAVVTALGTVVTVTPVSVGDISVSVTASDAAGLTATQTLAVNVVAANGAPVALGVVSDISLTLGVGVVAVDVSRNFSDPDGQALTFTAASADASVATVGMSGAVATVTPVGIGSTNATIVASDGSLTAIQSIGITVIPAPNSSPVAVGKIPALQLIENDTAKYLNIAASFSDPDGDALTYEATSANADMVTVEMLGTVVTVTPVSAGVSGVTITASDSGGLTATQTMAVEVLRSNSAPETVGSLDALALNVGDSSFGVDVSKAFSDPDKEPLTYTATSSDNAVAAVSVSGDRVLIASVSPGAASVAVVATDAAGLTAVQTIPVTVEVSGYSLVSSLPINQIELLPNYPSPFNPDTWIPFRLARDTNVAITIYDAGGALVRTFELGNLSAGAYESKGKAVYWDGRNDFGELVATGVYFYRLSTPDFSVTRKTSIRK